MRFFSLFWMTRSLPWVRSQIRPSNCYMQHGEWKRSSMTLYLGTAHLRLSSLKVGHRFGQKFSADFLVIKVNTYATVLAGRARYVTSSRRLAREILRRHICSLSVPVHTFESLEDEKWLA